jgi:hypothetical protein
MKIAAGIIVLLVAVVLLGGALIDYREDIDNAPERIRRGFSDVGNDAAFNRDMDEINSRKNSEMIRAVAGAAFLAAGLFVLGSSKKPRQP